MTEMMSCSVDITCGKFFMTSIMRAMTACSVGINSGKFFIQHNEKGRCLDQDESQSRKFFKMEIMRGTMFYSVPVRG